MRREYAISPRRGAGRRSREVGALVQPVPAVLAAYRPAQRHFGVEDLPEPNLVTAVVRLEQTRTPWDLVEAGEWLVRCETGDELLARVNPATTESGPSRH